MGLEIGKRRRLGVDPGVFVPTQAPNFMTQGGGSLAGKINGIYGFNGKVDVKDIGQVRLNTNNQRYVELIHWRHLTAKDGQTVKIWYVEDVLTEERYDMRQRNLGTQANAMEVIAWASK